MPLRIARLATLSLLGLAVCAFAGTAAWAGPNSQDAGGGAGQPPTTKTPAAKTASDKAASDKDVKKAPEAKTAAKKRRIVTVGGGQVSLDIRHWPLLGKPDAKYVFVEMFDYTCPYCRATHQAVRGAIEHLGDDLAIIALPVPLDSACNRTVLRSSSSQPIRSLSRRFETSSGSTCRLPKTPLFSAWTRRRRCRRSSARNRCCRCCLASPSAGRMITSATARSTCSRL